MFTHGLGTDACIDTVRFEIELVSNETDIDHLRDKDRLSTQQITRLSFIEQGRVHTTIETNQVLEDWTRCAPGLPFGCPLGRITIRGLTVVQLTS